MYTLQRVQHWDELEMIDKLPVEPQDTKEKHRRKSAKHPFILGIAAGAAAVLLVEFVIIPLIRTGSIAAVLLQNPAGSGKSAVNAASVRKLESLEAAIDEYYYRPEDITQTQLEDGMYKGLLESLDDPYSEYYNEEEMQELSESLSGQYAGIGAYISLDQNSGYPEISGVMPDTPAEKAGLQAGDIIRKVDGQDVLDESLDEVVSHVRGEEGTTVELSIVREGESGDLTITVERAKVDSPTVSSSMLDEEKGIGYIQIAEFDDVTLDQFEKALTGLQDEGLKGLVLDLRGNPGGSVDSVTAIAEYFLPEGLIFSMKDKNGKETDYSTDGSKELGLPLAVLVNGYSASASEILSGAIKDAGTGTLIGTTTYGKGVVQTVFSLHDGTAVKLTVADYYTRNGNSINKKGVTPDIELELDADAYRKDGTDNQLERASQVVSEKLSKTF